LQIQKIENPGFPIKPFGNDSLTICVLSSRAILSGIRISVLKDRIGQPSRMVEVKSFDELSSYKNEKMAVTYLNFSRTSAHPARDFFSPSQERRHVLGQIKPKPQRHSLAKPRRRKEGKNQHLLDHLPQRAQRTQRKIKSKKYGVLKKRHFFLVPFAALAS
ncbi:MAG: hypothetical protein JXB25_05115, partial [Deltaproteobacteria bacterium]|nr:hypothetical protein [Deltaproteobacteria bacterium]